MVPLTVDIELRRVFKELSRVGFVGRLDSLLATDPSNERMFVPYRYVVRLYDQRKSSGLKIYDFAARRIPHSCHGVLIAEVEILREGQQVYYEPRLNVRRGRLV